LLAPRAERYPSLLGASQPQARGAGRRERGMDSVYWQALVAAGLACGFLNTLASSGSAVSLPILVLLGVPEVAANATNRLPVLIGSAMATWSFDRKGQVDWVAAAKVMPVAVAGSVVGALTAERLGNRMMGLAITAAVLLALLMLFTKVKEALRHIDEAPPALGVKALALFFAVGFWLGFIVLDGATYLLLVLMLVCHYRLPQANALKSLTIAATTLVPILMFSRAGDVFWAQGVAMSAGSIAGGHLGAKLSNQARAKEWAFRLLVLVILFELVHLAWHYTAGWRAGS